jgi:maltose O-acetyltransferase
MLDDERIVELRALGARIGEGVYFGPTVYIEKDFAQLLSIGDGAVLSQGTTILLHDSSLNNVIGAAMKFGEVNIGERAYIGANSTILCGVTIGPRALVGACTLVNSDIPADAVAYGQPGRVMSTVAEAVDRQNTLWAQPDKRHFFVDTTPWRERTESEYAEFNASLSRGIDQFLEGIDSE